MILKDKLVLVTGAGNGMGKEISLLLLEKGAKVAAIDLNEEALKNLTEKAGEKTSNLSTYILNITDKEAIKSVSKKISKQQGEIDCLINNAGIIQPFVKVNQLEEDAIERVMNVNFYGTVNMIKEFLPGLLKKSEAHIVNVSSIGGFLPVPGQSVYGASKAAVKLLTEGLFAELLNTNVHVSVVFPGAINTNISANSGVKVSQKSADAGKDSKIPMTDPKKAAEIIVSGIEKNKPQIFVGNDSKMLNFLYRVSPVFATKMIAKKMQSLLS